MSSSLRSDNAICSWIRLSISSLDFPAVRAWSISFLYVLPNLSLSRWNFHSSTLIERISNIVCMLFLRENYIRGRTTWHFMFPISRIAKSPMLIWGVGHVRRQVDHNLVGFSMGVISRRGMPCVAGILTHSGYVTITEKSLKGVRVNILLSTAGFAISFQVSRKTHNHGHISIVASAANDRKGPKHTGTRIP